MIVKFLDWRSHSVTFAPLEGSLYFWFLEDICFCFKWSLAAAIASCIQCLRTEIMRNDAVFVQVCSRWFKLQQYQFSPSKRNVCRLKLSTATKTSTNHKIKLRKITSNYASFQFRKKSNLYWLLLKLFHFSSIFTENRSCKFHVFRHRQT